MGGVSAVTILDAPDGCLSSVLQPYLSQDRLHMNFNRGFGHVALKGDLLVGTPLCQVLENLLFTLRQVVTVSKCKRVVEGTIPRRLVRLNWRERLTRGWRSDHRTRHCLLNEYFAVPTENLLKSADKHI